ncbi:hypothetical protein MRX96_009694 [Rhipicephalus microplus]
MGNRGQKEAGAVSPCCLKSGPAFQRKVIPPSMDITGRRIWKVGLAVRALPGHARSMHRSLDRNCAAQRRQPKSGRSDAGLPAGADGCNASWSEGVRHEEV